MYIVYYDIYVFGTCACIIVSLAKPRLHTRREGLDNCLCASCAALHEIVQSNQIADRGNVTYAHIPPPTLCQSAIIHVCIQWEKQVHGSCRLVAAGVYQGCCYVSGYYYAKDKATRSHQTVHPRQRCVCIVAYWIWKECLLFSPPARV